MLLILNAHQHLKKELIFEHPDPRALEDASINIPSALQRRCGQVAIKILHGTAVSVGRKLNINFKNSFMKQNGLPFPCASLFVLQGNRGKNIMHQGYCSKESRQGCSPEWEVRWQELWVPELRHSQNPSWSDWEPHCMQRMQTKVSCLHRGCQ